MKKIDETLIPGFEKIKKRIEQISKKYSIVDLELFAKGHRGLIFKGKLKNKGIIIKIQREDLGAVGVLENEANRLGQLNLHDIGPKVKGFGNNYLIYEFVEGEFFQDFILHETKESILEIITKVFLQMQKLDSLNLNKEEMHHPIKHILVGEDKKITLLDFERCKFSKKPKNVTQFCQFISSTFLNERFAKKGISIDKEKLLGLARDYKMEPTEKNFKIILDFLGN